MSNFVEGLVTIVLAIVGLAIVATLVSPRARTSDVGRTFFSGVGNLIGVAQSPVTGSAVPLDLSYPDNSMGYAFGG